MPQAVEEVEDSLQELMALDSFGGMTVDVPVKMQVWSQDWFAEDTVLAFSDVGKAFNSFLGPVNRINDILSRTYEVCTSSHCWKFTIRGLLEGLSPAREDLLEFVLAPFRRMIGHVSRPIATSIERALKDPLLTPPIDTRTPIPRFYDEGAVEDIQEHLGQLEKLSVS